MPRTKGAKAQSHEAKRAGMLARIRARLGQRGAPRASWREMAEAAGVGLSTLAHYFGRRDDVILALFALDEAEGLDPLRVLARPDGDFADSVESAVRHLLAGWRHGVGDMVAIGLTEALHQPALSGPFLTRSIEPMIDALAVRLAAHVARGEMRPGDCRIAALEILGPLVLAGLHQDQLDGASTHPLEMDRLADALAQSFVRAHTA